MPNKKNPKGVGGEKLMGLSEQDKAYILDQSHRIEKLEQLLQGNKTSPQSFIRPHDASHSYLARYASNNIREDGTKYGFAIASDHTLNGYKPRPFIFNLYRMPDLSDEPFLPDPSDPTGQTAYTVDPNYDPFTTKEELTELIGSKYSGQYDLEKVFQYSTPIYVGQVNVFIIGNNKTESNIVNLVDKYYLIQKDMWGKWILDFSSDEIGIVRAIVLSPISFPPKNYCDTEEAFLSSLGRIKIDGVQYAHNDDCTFYDLHLASCPTLENGEKLLKGGYYEFSQTSTTVERTNSNGVKEEITYIYYNCINPPKYYRGIPNTDMERGDASSFTVADIDGNKFNFPCYGDSIPVGHILYGGAESYIIERSLGIEHYQLQVAAGACPTRLVGHS
jgi:hypothetical protein